MNLKKIIALVLVFTMCLSLIPTYAIADEGEYSLAEYVSPTCADDGYARFVNEFGDEYTETYPATGEHDFVDGYCTACGAEDPDYVGELVIDEFDTFDAAEEPAVVEEIVEEPAVVEEIVEEPAVVEEAAPIEEAVAEQPAADTAVADEPKDVTALAVSNAAAFNNGEDVAQIGEAQFGTLGEAFGWAKNGDTIVLLDDVEIDTGLFIGVNVTLDLNGHNLSTTSGDILHVNEGTTLTITGGGTFSVHVYIEGNVVVSDPNLILDALNGATFDVVGGKIETTAAKIREDSFADLQYLKEMYGIPDGYTATKQGDYWVVAEEVDNSNLTLTQFVEAVRNGNGTFDGGSDRVTVTWDTTYTSDDTDSYYYRANDGDETMQYCPFNGIVDLNISNVDFVFTPAGAIYNAQIQAYNSGNTTFSNCTFDRVGIQSYNKDNTSNVSTTVTGCTFRNLTEQYAVKHVKSKNVTISGNTFVDCASGILLASIEGETAGTITISNNTFTGVSYTAGEFATKDRGVIQFAGALKIGDSTNISVTDNKFTNTGSLIRYISTSENYKPILFTGNQYADSTPLNWTGTGAKTLYIVGDYLLDYIPVAQIGDTTYPTLKDALTAAQAGQTITLLADVDANAVIEITKSITIDGGGHKLNTTATRGIWIAESDVDVTIKNLEIVPGAKTERAVQVNNGMKNVKLTLENVTASCTDYTVNICSDTENLNLTIKDCDLTGWSAVNLWSNGTVNITNSTLTGINDKSYNADGWNNFGTVAVEGDTTGQTDMHASSYVINITGGKIVCKQTTGNGQSALVFNNPSTQNKIVISGTEFELADNYLIVDDNLFDAKGNVTNEFYISGGKFASTPEVPTGYAAALVNNAWTIGPKGEGSVDKPTVNADGTATTEYSVPIKNEAGNTAATIDKIPVSISVLTDDIAATTVNDVKGIGSYYGNGVTKLASVNATSKDISIPENETWLDMETATKF